MLGSYIYDGIGRKFTGKERDTETCSPTTPCLDYLGARHYASGFGRFMSVDPKAASGKLLNPQTCNRYAYTLNNPLKFVDTDGMDVVLAAGVSQQDRTYVVNNLARLDAREGTDNARR